MKSERRRHRSPFTSIALGRWLDAVAARNGLSGLVLGDACGLLVAHGAMDVDRAEAVAAIAPIDSVVDVPGAMRVLRFEHEGAPLVLAGLGQEPRLDALVDAQIGVARILSERAAA
ncbi:MAG: hypothetical protein HYV09_02005 [Deltaproteobacteria bacterium]|nr:hypothetical protein [Deltaproteobacteria bacterium]